jgi:hypothetical protein
MSTVYLATAPDGTVPVIALSGRFDRFQGALSVLIRPADKARRRVTTKGLNLSLFHALGKDLRTVGSYAAETMTLRRQTQAWLTAYNTRDVVIFEGQFLTEAVLRDLLDYLDSVPRVTFACETNQTEVIRQALANHGTTVHDLPWGHLDTWLPATDSTYRPSTPKPPYTLADLPKSDFLTFRHDARRLTEPGIWEAVDQDYRNTYKHALDAPIDLDAAISMLAACTADATSTGPVLVALRATQAALFTRGFLLAAHTDKALGTLSAIKPTRPTDHHWHALHGYLGTARGAGAAVYLLNTPADQLNDITLDDAQDWLHANAANGMPIHPLARSLLAAHLHARESDGAEGNDSYLNRPGRSAIDDLIDARRHLGIPIDARNLKPADIAHTHRPLYRFGLELRNLT